MHGPQILETRSLSPSFHSLKPQLWMTEEAPEATSTDCPSGLLSVFQNDQVVFNFSPRLTEVQTPMVTFCSQRSRVGLATTKGQPLGTVEDYAS